MDEIAQLQKVQGILQARKWTGGTATVFNQANHVALSPITNNLAAIRSMANSPIALIKPGNVTNDPQVPALLIAQFVVRLVVVLMGDVVGQNMLIGANRQPNTSQGAGLLQVQAEMFLAIQDLNTQEGLTIQSVARSATGAVLDEVGSVKFIGWRDYLFEGKCTSS